MTTVAICTLGYRRPAGLSRLLAALEELEVPPGDEVTVIVVDNDPEGTGREVVEAHAATSRLDVRYHLAGAGSISAGRNAAVEQARGHELMAFIDDDEWPDPSWLRELLVAKATTDADVVTGPVLPVFDEPPPRWAVDGGFFDRPRHAHLEAINYATTSSVLIDLRVLGSDGEAPFDAAFGRSGGEDTHFFAGLRRRGARIVWSDKAVVYEAVPATRVRIGWVLRREYRRGNTLSLSLRRFGLSPVLVVRRVAHGAQEISMGAVGVLGGVVSGRAAALRGAHRMCFGVGLLTGLIGLRYEEYLQHHGR